MVVRILDYVASRHKPQEVTIVERPALGEHQDVSRAHAIEVGYTNLVQVGTELAVKHIAGAKERFRAGDIGPSTMAEDAARVCLNMLQAQVRRRRSLAGLYLPCRRPCDLSECRLDPALREFSRSFAISENGGARLSGGRQPLPPFSNSASTRFSSSTAVSSSDTASVTNSSGSGSSSASSNDSSFSHLKLSSLNSRFRISAMSKDRQRSSLESPGLRLARPFGSEP